MGTTNRAATRPKTKDWKQIHSVKMDRLGGGAGRKNKKCPHCGTTHKKKRCPWCEAQGRPA